MKICLNVFITCFFIAIIFTPLHLSAARIISVTLCEQVDNTGTIPINIRQQFSSEVPAIHALVELSQLSSGTRIKGSWISVDAIDVPNYEIDFAEVLVDQPEAVVHFSLSRPTNGWPTGNYKLDIYLNGKLSASSTFSIGRSMTTPSSPSPQTSKPQSSSGFNGQYVLNAQGVSLYLNMQQDAQGKIGGTLSSTTGTRFQLEGEVQQEVAMGICYDQQSGSFFEAYFQGNQLIFNLIEPDQNNMPDYSRSRQLIFSRGTGTQPSGYPQTTSPQAPARQPSGSGQEYLLQGTLCSWSGSSSGYGNSSYSRSTKVYFDGQGNFSYSSEASFSGDAGIAYGGDQGSGQGGTYRIVGNQVYLQFNDGTSGVAQINMQQDDGRITELMYEGTLYATGLCE